jgi:predicted transcriptional regulator
MKTEQLIFTLPKGRIKGIFQFDFLISNGDDKIYLHLKNDTRKTILNTIEEKPGITGKELAAKLQLDKSTVHWHLKDLSADNIVHSQRDGRFKRYYLRERTLNL